MTFFTIAVVISLALSLYLDIGLNIRHSQAAMAVESVMDVASPGFSSRVEPLSFMVWFCFIFTLIFSFFVVVSARTFIALSCVLGFFGVMILVLNNNPIGAMVALLGAIMAGFLR